jgi:hypothetical protein
MSRRLASPAQGTAMAQISMTSEMPSRYRVDEGLGIAATALEIGKL